MPIAFKCSCGKAYKVPDETAGKKIKCKECGEPLQVPASGTVKKPAAKKAKAGGGDDGDIFTMDLGLDEPPQPSELPPRRKKADAAPKKKKSSGGKSKKKETNKGLVIGVGVVSFLVAAVGGFFAVQAITGGGGGGAKAPAQVNYGQFKHELGGFAVKYPADWTKQDGGGTGGRPPFAYFEDGTARIDIRHNEKGASIATMASLPSGGQIIPGEQVEEEPPAKSVHEFMSETVYSNDYTNWEELPGKEFKTPYGNGWISEATFKEGLGTKMKAYHVTYPGTSFQYNIIAKCPERKWEQYEPIFLTVLNSMGN